MSYNTTFTVNFLKTDYKDNKPKLGQVGQYNKTLKFVNYRANLPLSDVTNGLIEVNISFTGDVDYGSIWFVGLNGGTVSVGEEIDKSFINSSVAYPMENVFHKKGDGITNKTYYLIVNSDNRIKSKYFSVYVDLAKDNVAPISSSITFSYNCDSSVNNPVHSYEMGLHTYSPYDAIKSGSTLSTTLFSLTPIESWGVNTSVFMTPSLDIPALTYCYGYGDKVYRVGAPFKRSFGILKHLYIHRPSQWQRMWGQTTTRELRTTKPQSYLVGSKGDGFTSFTCVYPTFGGIGKIKEIMDVSSLHPPQTYRYYMGEDNTDMQKSNDNYFTMFDFDNQVTTPIVGSTHALLRTYDAIIKTYYREQFPLVTDKLYEQMFAMFYNALYPQNGSSTNSVVTITPTPTPTPTSNSLETYLFPPNHVYGGGSGGSEVTNNGGSFPWWIFLILLAGGIGYGIAVSSILALAIIFFVAAVIIAALVVALIIGIKNFFASSTHDYYENCRSFIHCFTDTPYIQIGHTLYDNLDLTTILDGYYCDGIYFYQQSGETIISKTLSYSQTLLTPPSTYARVSSLQADNPTKVTDMYKLIALPYTSGQSEPYCGGGTIYYNVEMSQTITNTCCDLEICSDIVIDVPAGEFFSCSSQVSADDKAQEVLDSAVADAQNNGKILEPFPDSDIGETGGSFTHELKIENTPNNISLFYDATTPGIVVGKNLYYDSCGCTKVFDGYYAVTGDTYFRTFYHTTNGQIDGIYNMETSNSTVTTTSEPIITTNTDYTSNWFITDINARTLDSDVSKMLNNRYFNPNTLYTDPKLVKGFIKTPGNVTNFQVYTGFTTTNYEEASTGWYKPLIGWSSNISFFYTKAIIIELDIKQKCEDLMGFNIIGMSGGEEITTFDPISLTINVYDQSDTLIATYDETTSNVTSTTFVQFDSQINNPNLVGNIIISSINSPNPLNNVTYVTGSTTPCSITGSTTPTPTVTPTSSIGTSVTPTVTPTVSIGASVTPTVTPTSSIGTSVTPTRTPTPTPSTSPNSSPTANVEIFVYAASNDRISSVNVNGVEIDGVTFPIGVNSAVTGTTTQLGTYDVTITLDIADATSSIGLYDGNSAFHLINVSGTGPYVFTNIIIGSRIIIELYNLTP